VGTGFQPAAGLLSGSRRRQECRRQPERQTPQAIILLLVSCAAYGQTAAPPIRGFAPEEWKSRHELEEKAKALANPERIRISMERIAGSPHVAGSPGSKAVAEYAAAQMKEWGLDSRIETFEALMPYPAAGANSRQLEMISPVRFRASLKEPAIPGDPATEDNGQIPTYNAYSASGDVTAPLIYVNYGMPDDYAYLKRQSIDVKGKIVIVRYGKGWRGLKPKLAQEHGAVACLIYSDPRDDGYFQGDPYPKGFARSEMSVQRGSVMNMMLYPGDPLSPGWASEPGAKKLAKEDAATILKIPVMPISWGDAKPLLEQLDGEVAPEAWRGALPFTYHIGPGPATVHFKIDFDWANRPLYDAQATIPGSVYKDQWIVYGNHHDAWANGANDPTSGAAALLETARVLATLAKQGWQPKRTIVLSLWDGEEFGLLGSTEWVEKHQEELERKAAVYINSDSNGLGNLSASGSHTLEAFFKEVMRDTLDPRTQKSLLEMARARRGPEFHLGALGAGSDYVAFLDHAGVASLNFGFGSNESGGVYHSSYDTLTWYDRFSDANHAYGKTLTQMMTTSILRLADAPVLPFEFETLAEQSRRWAAEIQKEAPTKPPTVDLRGVTDQLAKLSAASKAWEDELAALWKRLGGAAPEKLVKLNETLSHSERTLLSPAGLPGREWYRHLLYAPGMNTGYGVKTIPGVREAVEGQRWREANREAVRVTQGLRAMTAQVEEATRMLKGAE
jgi:N-acetylated-alpha-linked acidic dipeptidase